MPKPEWNQHYVDRMPIHSEFFLPARKTDLIAVRDLDPDALHEELWATANHRNRDEVKRPTVNNYIVAMMIAQGRLRRHAQRYYVKDPAQWRKEAMDLRGAYTRKGRWRCQFCGTTYEYPPKVDRKQLVACWTCSELIGLRSYFTANLWDGDGKLV